jgi:hypothetical protein
VQEVKISGAVAQGSAGEVLKFAKIKPHRLNPASLKRNRRNSDLMPTEERSRLPVAFMVGIVIVALLVGAAMLYSRYAKPPVSEDDKPLPMGQTELTYAPQIHFLEPKMSRAANFLNQEVTYVFCTVENGGDRKVHQIEITIEFHDPFNQVILRDKQRLFLSTAPPFLPGQQRDVQIPYEHIPPQWNNVYPSIAVSGLAFN